MHRRSPPAGLQQWVRNFDRLFRSGTPVRSDERRGQNEKPLALDPVLVIRSSSSTDFEVLPPCSPKISVVQTMHSDIPSRTPRVPGHFSEWRIRRRSLLSSNGQPSVGITQTNSAAAAFQHVAPFIQTRFKRLQSRRIGCGRRAQFSDPCTIVALARIFNCQGSF